mgnify:FL=1
MKFKNEDVAARQVRWWHQKERGFGIGDVEDTFNFPDTVVCLGRAEEIVYHSDKWEEDGDFFPYTHTFDSHPQVYGLGVGSREKTVASLLGVQRPNSSSWAMPLLAFVDELTFDDGKKLRRVKFKGSPVMTCSPDKKTVVILSKSKPFFIRGGKMIVTPRGIVK